MKGERRERKREKEKKTQLGGPGEKREILFLFPSPPLALSISSFFSITKGY
jgi:hypothetical protein